MYQQFNINLTISVKSSIQKLIKEQSNDFLFSVDQCCYYNQIICMQSAKEKRTLFHQEIRRQKLNEEIAHLRCLRDNSENILPLLENLTDFEGLKQFDKHCQFQPQNAFTLTKLLYEKIKEGSLQIVVKEYKFLNVWLNCLARIIQYHPDLYSTILQKVFMKPFEAGLKMRAYQSLFVFFRSIINDKVDLDETIITFIQKNIQEKWKQQINQTGYTPIYFGKYELHFYLYILRCKPVVALSYIMSDWLVAKMSNHITKNYYQPSLRKQLIQCLICITYHDKKHYYPNVSYVFSQILIQNKIVDHLRFLINFFKDQYIVERCCILMHNLLIQVGCEQFWRSGIFADMINTIKTTKSKNAVRQLKNAFFLYILSIGTQEGFNHFKQIDGFDVIIDILSEQGIDLEILQNGLEALSYLFLIGKSIEDGPNPYILKFRYTKGQQILKRHEKGIEFLERWELI